MGKERGQIKINIGAELKSQFDDECELQRMKPGQLASIVLSWYLRQPAFIRSHVRQGMESVPEKLAEATAREILNHLMKDSSRPANPAGASRPTLAAADAQQAINQAIEGFLESKSGKGRSGRKALPGHPPAGERARN